MPSFTFNKPYYNVAPAANTLACEEAWNVYFEAMPQGGYAIRRRPGLSKINNSGLTTTETCRGVYWSDRNRRLYCVINGSVYTKPGFNSALKLIGTMDDFNKTAIFAEGQLLDLTDIIYIANGGGLRYIDSSTNTLETPTDPNTPASNFIAMMNNRFYADNVNYGQDFLITDVNPASDLMDSLYWSSAVNPFRASQKPDNIRGIYTGWNEVYIWGSMANEVWQEDGVTPVSPLVGSLMEIGLEAPYSVVMADNTMFALCVLNGKRTVVSVAGRAPQVLSEAIAVPLQKYGTVTDAVGSLCFVGGLNMYILSFPTEQVTWAYDFKTQTWSQWSSWDMASGQHIMFQGRYGAYAKAWNKHIMQGQDGSLYEFSRSVYDDDGTPIRSSVRTGWIDHGTWDRKRSDQLIIKLQGYANKDAHILMRWRSDGFPEWSTPMELPIQYNQQNDHFCKLNRMGMYRSRQYEFIMTDAADLALIGMEEDLTRMRN